MDKQDIKKLATLSRLELSDEKIEEYQKDFEGILEYIDTINSVSLDGYDDHLRSITTNIMRDDSDSYLSGQFSEDLLNAAPLREGNFIKVKKIL
ncbi:MAG: aspartyl-tRNA(Asn)/glutamyl-tRNA(Gln) amidotransferase subunit C [Crocinitomicaceae bacterium]|jgi:aspartyl-tRNA(Asn)/glutamyl-tRNA(Gln) amidotransferase subunit C